MQAHKGSLNSSQRDGIVVDFDTAWLECLSWVTHFCCASWGNAGRDRVALQNEYRVWGKKLRALLQEALRAEYLPNLANDLEGRRGDSPDRLLKEFFRRIKANGLFQPLPFLKKFNDLVREQLELMGKVALMTEFNLEWVTRAEAELERRKKKSKPPRRPCEQEIQAYVTYKQLGYTQEKVAGFMTERLNPEKPFKQYWVARAIQRCEAWLKANSLEAFPEEIRVKMLTMDPYKLGIGARTDGRGTGDARHKKLEDHANWDA